MDSLNSLLDITQICRLCLSHDRPLSLIFAENDLELPKHQMALKIAECVSIIVEPDSQLPNKVCNRCTEQVENWVKFKELCDNANTLLHQCLAAGISPISEVINKDLPKSDSEHTTKTQSDFCFEGVSLLEDDSLFQNIRDPQGKCLPSNDLLESDTLSMIFDEGSENIKITSCETEVKTQDNKQTSEALRTIWREKYNRFYRKKYICGICPRVFTKFNELIKHDQLEHRDIYSNEMCTNCGHLFVTRHRLKTHYDIKHKEKLFECEKCGYKGVSEKTLKIHQIKHSEKFLCFCGFSACNLKSLQDHKRTHSLKRIYQCNKCSKSFKQQQGLRNHITLLHTVDSNPPYKCDVCLQLFKTGDYLKKHKASVHSARCTICEICGAVMKNKTSLYVHKLTHKDKKHTCEVCDKKFYTRNLLTRHMRTHGDHTFVCLVCNKSYNRADTLSMHMATHSTVQNHCCKLCGQCFTLNKYLQRHIARIHNK